MDGGKTKTISNAFSNFNPKNMSNFTKYVNGGMIRPIWGNRATRALMRKTKWYYAFLQHAFGTNKYIDPEDLENNYGMDVIDQKAQEFNKTDLGNNLWETTIAGKIGSDKPADSQSVNVDSSNNNFDITTLLFGNIFA